jgi:hypothetical protein
MTAIVLYLLHHLRAEALLVLLSRAAAAIARAFWEGARKEVVQLGEDVSTLVFARARRRLGRSSAKGGN